MKKVLLSILEPAHIQKGEVLQRKRTYDYEEGYEDILKSGNYVNNSGFYVPDRKEHVEFVVQMIPGLITGLSSSGSIPVSFCGTYWRCRMY